MRSIDPDDLAEWISGVWYDNRKPHSICGFSFDARKLARGECFIALSGGIRDGHAFVSQAQEGGAVALLVERVAEVDLPQLIVPDTLEAMAAIALAIRKNFKGPLIGVTGSSGKTSTKEMLGSLLGIRNTHTTRGNWNNRIGVPMTLFDLDSERHDFSVIEAGINQPGEMAELGEMIAADLCVVTNIGPAHLELLGTMGGVATEKALLFEHASREAKIILTVETFAYPAFSRFFERAIVLAEEGMEVRPQAMQVVRYRVEPLEGGALQLSINGCGSYRIATTSHGIATNAALAITAAGTLGIAEPLIQERIEGWRPAQDRGQFLHFEKQIFYVDCYNANPASMADALRAFEALVGAEGPRCYVLGAMNELGAGAADWHRKTGGLLRLRSCDCVWFVGPSDLIAAYAEGARGAGVLPDQLRLVDDVEKVKSGVAEFLGLIFLKGSRAYQLEKLLPENS